MTYKAMFSVIVWLSIQIVVVATPSDSLAPRQRTHDQRVHGFDPRVHAFDPPVKLVPIASGVYEATIPTDKIGARVKLHLSVSGAPIDSRYKLSLSIGDRQEVIPIGARVRGLWSQQ